MTRKECIDGIQRIIDEDQNKILVRVHVGYLIHAVKYLKDQPEVVQCKDCEYWLPMNRFVPDYHPGRGECELNCWVRDCDWFCADGIRKDKRD